MQSKYLVTGAMGCIGAWVIRNLIKDNQNVFGFDLSDNAHRLRLIMSENELDRVQFIQGDITDTELVKKEVKDNAITHIIHLAALQVPFCQANPPKGATVNVLGTVNIFEAAKSVGIQNLVYASSLAVYGRKDEYAQELIPADAMLNPHTHYGIYKIANEGTARIYWENDGIASIGLRPNILFGPGRDQGMTSKPTIAMLSAARNEKYHIPFGGRYGFQFADDVANILIRASDIDTDGAKTYNLRGSVADMSELVAAIEAAAPSAEGLISYEQTALPFPVGAEDKELQHLLGTVPQTSLEEGVSKTIAMFENAFERELL